MARLLALDECPVSLRNHLIRSLRPLDEAVLLPQAQRGDESGVYKNVTFRLAGDEPNVPMDIFSQSWFTGVSAIRIDVNKPAGVRLREILNDPKARAEALARLRDAIPTESADSSLKSLGQRRCAAFPWPGRGIARAFCSWPPRRSDSI